jgi:hypothetical protein
LSVRLPQAMLPDAKRKMSEKGRHKSEMQELPGGSESDHRSGSYSEVAPTQKVETNFPIVSLLHHDSFSSATTSSDPGQFRKDALRCAQILLHQFRGLPPPTALSSSGNHVPPYENRFWSICSPKVLLRKIGVGVDSLLPGESLQHGGFTDSIVYDRDTASVPGLHLPLVLDMVRDGVKNRLLNVLGFASVFCSVILIFSSFIFVVQQAPIPRNVSLFFLTMYLFACSSRDPPHPFPLVLLSDRCGKATRFTFSFHKLPRYSQWFCLSFVASLLDAH